MLDSVRRYAKPHVLATINSQTPTASLLWARTRLQQLDAMGPSCSLVKTLPLLRSPPHL